MKQIKEFLFSYSIIVIILSIDIICFGMRRGPHHPRGEVVKRSANTKLDEHLVHEETHLDDDLNKIGVNVNESALTEEEKHFYHFKIHDNDNNNALDGLEMLYAALHHERSLMKTDYENSVTADEQQSAFDHVVEVIDDFLDIADTDKDGFLQYPEYMRAINDNQLD
ncbi:multiple coagulation factor deficiency protein 2 homolog [Condylostylus longicornis]|uniref:multiple coagulation factor deficiency protein 2 homolog n=1 Tax=Condylostylus longicornis TaxID=2530218 RepID=UPI00244D9DC9|nr:multiple coagulation factor deficiency protein 2 homolog [Condylostylus longicornis]